MRNALHTAVNSPHDPETAFRLFDEAVASDGDTHSSKAMCVFGWMTGAVCVLGFVVCGLQNAGVL